MATPFLLPKTLYQAGALQSLPQELAALGVSRPLLITDPGIASAGLVGRLLNCLGSRIAVFTDVHSNPMYSDAVDACARYVEESCDSVIALGGGSVIDTAKFTAILAANGGSPADYVGPQGTPIARVAPLVAIPTTAGTGSECSPDAGIHPDVDSPSTGVSSWQLVPKTAILDVNLTLSLPRSLTAATGLDALSHCIEGFLSTRISPLVDILALEGIRRISLFLRRAVTDGSDVEARHEMLAAAFAGGAAISKGLGPAHALAITCSDQGLHHGVLSAIGVISTLALVSSVAAEKILAIHVAMGLPPTASVVDGVAQLCSDVGLPTSLREAGYTIHDLESLSTAAEASHFNLSAVYRPSAAEFRRCFVTNTH